MKMTHPDIDTVAEVTDERVYHAVWAPRGWVLLPAAEAYATEILGKPVKKLDDLKVDELKQLVSSRGLDYPNASAKKADVKQTFLESFVAPPASPLGDSEALLPDGLPTDPATPAGETSKDK